MTKTTLDVLFDCPEGCEFLWAVGRIVDGPRAPTKSGYWLGMLMGEPVDQEAARERELKMDRLFP